MNGHHVIVAQYLRKNAASPRNFLSPLKPTGTGQSVIAVIFPGSGRLPCLPTMHPRGVISLTANTHFLSLTYRSCLRNCNNLTKVCFMSFHVLLSAHSPSTDEYIVEVTRCEISHQSKQIRNASVECSGGVAQPLWHY